MSNNNIENKPSLNRGENGMKRFCSSLRECTVNVINFEKKKMLPLSKKKAKITARYDGMLNLWEKILK